MSIVDHRGEVEYPFSKNTVFKAIMEAASDISGLSLDSADELSGTVTFKAGVSLASWGENIPIQLEEISSVKTRMKVLSTPKTGVMFGGTMDFGKNRQNIDKIINAVSKVLSTKPKEKETICSQQVSIADEIAKLNELKKDGVLSDEEFETQKSRLLDLGTNKAIGEVSETEESTQQNETPIRIEGEVSNSTNYALIALVIFVIFFVLLMLM